VLAWLRESHPVLMLEDVKDMINHNFRGVKTESSLIFVVVGEVFSLLHVGV